MSKKRSDIGGRNALPEQTFSDEKIQLIKELKDAIENLNKIHQGKLKAKPINELLAEL